MGSISDNRHYFALGIFHCADLGGHKPNVRKGSKADTAAMAGVGGKRTLSEDDGFGPERYAGELTAHDWIEHRNDWPSKPLYPFDDGLLSICRSAGDAHPLRRDRRSGRPLVRGGRRATD
jgi:hypothetical protein